MRFYHLVCMKTFQINNLFHREREKCVLFGEFCHALLAYYCWRAWARLSRLDVLINRRCSLHDMVVNPVAYVSTARCTPTACISISLIATVSVCNKRIAENAFIATFLLSPEFLISLPDHHYQSAESSFVKCHHQLYTKKAMRSCRGTNSSRTLYVMHALSFFWVVQFYLLIAQRRKVIESMRMFGFGVCTTCTRPTQLFALWKHANVIQICLAFDSIRRNIELNSSFELLIFDVNPQTLINQDLKINF